MKNPKKSIDSTTKRDGLFIPTRQMSGAIAGMVVLASLVFMVGYMVGKKHVVEQFVARVEHDSFADQIYSSLCALYDCDMPENVASNEEVVSNSPEIETSIDEIIADVEQPLQPEAMAENNTKLMSVPQYYAQLIGYGTRKAAQQFAEKLQKRNVGVAVEQRVSKTAGGKQRTWYQVVTEKTTDRDALENLVASLSQAERLSGASVISC